MIKYLIKYLYNKIKYRGKVEFPYSCIIDRGSEIEGPNKFADGVVFWGKIGKGSYIGRNSEILGFVGRYTSIASGCKVLHGSHPITYPYVTTSPAFYSMGNQTRLKFANTTKFDEQIYADVVNRYPIVIGNDCWINGNVSFNPGVKIGNGAVILAGAVVTKDIPAYAIAGGVPARVLKYRYSEDDIILLEEFKWWNQSDEFLKENWEKFSDFSKFKELILKRNK